MAGYGIIATFVSADFRAAYPAFALNPSDPTLQTYFDLAGEVWWRNDGTSPVRTVTLQTKLMYMLTAHVTFLFSGPDGLNTSDIVGRVSSTTEGSVTVASEYASTNNSQWFDQSPYGAAFWQATAAFRSGGRFIPGPTRFGTGINIRGGGRRGF